MINFPQYEVRIGDDLGEPDFWNRRWKDADLRLHGQELIEKDWRDAIRELTDNGVRRIDEAFSPLLAQLEQDAQLGALFVSTTTSTLPIGTGTLTIAITDANRRRFAPAATIALVTNAAPYAVMIGTTVSYSRDTGTLTLQVERAYQNGGAATRAGWTVSATSRIDYLASRVFREAGGGIQATDVEAALREILTLVPLRTRSITAGTGLKDGGDLTQDRSLAFDVQWGDVRYTLAQAFDAHTHTFGSITSKPTTLAGYGISDAYTKGQVDTALANKSPVGHGHVVGDVTGLQGALDAKLDDSQATAFGLSLLGGADQAAGRVALGLGSFATKSVAATSDLQDGAATNAKLANVSSATIKGRATSGAGAPEDLTGAQVKAILGITTADVGGFSAALAAKQDALGFTPLDSAAKGAANGVAGLGSDGKVPASQLPADGSYKGVYNATTNSPAISNGSGTRGDFFIVNVAGTVAADGVGAVAAGDQIRRGPTAWERVPSFSAVSSVAGKSGAVTLAAADLTDATTTGKALVTAVDQAAGRTALGLGSLATKSTIGSGDVTDGAIANVDLATVASGTFKARSSAGTGSVEDLTVAQAKALLAIAAADITNASTIGRTVLTAADAAAVRTALGLAAMALAASVGTANIDASAVTNAKLADVATATFKARSSAGTGAPEDLTVSQAKTLLALAIADVSGLQGALDAKLDDSQATTFGLSLLDDADQAAARTTLGLGTMATQATGSFVPISHAGAGGAAHAAVTTSVNGFMLSTDKAKLDGVATGANNYVHPSGDGNSHVPATSTTNNRRVLIAGATAGSFGWGQVAFGELAGLPTTLSGYGITDAYSSGTVDTLLSGKQNTIGYTPENASNKGQANGYVGLDGTGKISSTFLPALAITDTFVVATQAAMLALTAEVGDIAVRSDLSKTFILRVSPASTLANWTELATPADAVSSVAGRTGAVTLTSADLTDASAYARSLLDDADAATARGTLGLGSLATKSTVATADLVAGAATNTILADMAQNTFKGRASTGAGDPEDLTAAQVAGILPVLRTDVAQGLTVTQKIQARQNLGTVGSGVVTVASAGTIAASHAGQLVVLNPSAAMTLGLTAAATLGNGFAVMVKNIAPYTVTIDPAGTETIDGLATIPLYKGQECWLVTDGTAWRTFGLEREWTIATALQAGGTAVAFTLPPDIDAFRLTGFNMFSSGSTVQPYMRVGTGGTPDATAAAYGSQVMYAVNNVSPGQNLVTGDYLANLAPQMGSTAASAGTNFDMLIEPGVAGGGVAARFRWSASGLNSALSAEQVMEGAGYWNKTGNPRIDVVQIAGVGGAQIAGRFTLRGISL